MSSSSKSSAEGDAAKLRQLAQEMFDAGNTADKVERVGKEHFFCCPNLAVGLLTIAEEMRKMQP